MAKYRKKPVVIDAIQWTGENMSEMQSFCGEAVVFKLMAPPIPVFKTLEGELKASIGDWIIKGVKGEFYPCKPDIFAATYESA